ncbi:MAG: amino acid permease [Hornefia butyriciproducens]|uniref:amino acid permease n=1 Tax=Hornefia butyriciproducens TaxID=2652293 RepID=UPI002A762141|nr:amino acid permease [Hornefia butyriciproducens]MCI7327775.1 amino acid permease [Clostridiales bacterium]MCI7413047.1 amino acid permease [Clostridiales bacterium]MDY2991277.1 amino acid permease [Hornefia butyriciproducens]MDY6211420.1 amino acid permease [Hornefia butyriciproducens]
MSKDTGNNNSLRRGLKGRHLQMIAIGGSIGTGLFLAMGGTIRDAGPGGAMVAYAIMSVVVYFMMTALGEMATELPIPGAFTSYANRFVDPAWGFTNGWAYWFGSSMTVAAELIAGAIIIKYWFPDVNSAVFVVLFLAILLALNLFSVKGFGEAEFWFAGIKVVITVIFLVVGVLMIIGIMHSGEDAGFHNWVLDGGKAGKAPFVNGIGGMVGIFMVAAFSFSNTELVGLSAAESENPKHDVPKAIHSVFWRLVIFYLGTIFVVATLIPFTEPSLLDASESNVAAAPYTIIFRNAGFAAAASLMNAVILTSVLSCGNSSMYAASRTMQHMAEKGDAPKFFAKISKRGVPVRAVLLTAFIAAFAFVASLLGDGVAYTAAYYLCGIAGVYNWLTISFAHYRFRRGWIKQGRSLDELDYKSPFYPAGSIFTIVVCIIVCFGANWWVFTDFNWFDFITCYAIIPLSIVMFFVYKKVKHTKWVAYEDMDFTPPDGISREDISAID